MRTRPILVRNGNPPLGRLRQQPTEPREPLLQRRPPGGILGRAFERRSPCVARFDQPSLPDQRQAEEVARPERLRIEAAAVVGRIGDPAMLDEKLRAREKPSGRKPISDLAFAGSFPG